MQVVQPQEGSKVVACAESRYEFEVFSGTVLGVPKSEAQNAAEGLLKKLFGFGKGACQAVHEMVVRTPDGTSRTFRFGTTSADVPAQVRPAPQPGPPPSPRGHMHATQYMTHCTGMRAARRAVLLRRRAGGIVCVLILLPQSHGEMSAGAAVHTARSLRRCVALPWPE